MVFRFATVQGMSIQWTLYRKCAVTLARLGCFYLSLCVVFRMGAGCWLRWVSSLLDVRHAAGSERICLQGECLVVECESAVRLDLRPGLEKEIRMALRVSDKHAVVVSDLVNLRQ
jgi:hypothetical protein